MDSCKIPLIETKRILALGRKFLTLIASAVLHHMRPKYPVRGIWTCSVETTQNSNVAISSISPVHHNSSMYHPPSVVTTLYATSNQMLMLMFMLILPTREASRCGTDCQKRPCVLPPSVPSSP